MNSKLVEICKKEINELFEKKIKKSYSSWSCSSFYVENAVELKRGASKLVINYKPLNKSLRLIRYPIPNKKKLLDMLNQAVIFSKFGMKFGY